MDDSFNKSCLGTDVGVSSRRGGRVLSAGGVAQRTRCRSRLSALDNDARDNPLKSSVCRDGVQVFAASGVSLLFSYGQRARAERARRRDGECATLSSQRESSSRIVLLPSSPAAVSAMLWSLPCLTQQQKEDQRGGRQTRVLHLHIHGGGTARCCCSLSLSLLSLSLYAHLFFSVLRVRDTLVCEAEHRLALRNRGRVNHLADAVLAAVLLEVKPRRRSVGDDVATDRLHRGPREDAAVRGRDDLCEYFCVSEKIFKQNIKLVEYSVIR